MDSSYLLDFVKTLKFSGNVWLVDFPGNGSNDGAFSNFDAWNNFLIDTVKMFASPIIIGHSYGGILPLLCPKLENHLKGLILLNSTPSDWTAAAEQLRLKHRLPDLSPLKNAFLKNPTDENIKKFFISSAPFFFLPDKLEKGREFLNAIPFNFHALNWFHYQVSQKGYSAKWIPHKVPTLIISGNSDLITPPSLFTEDARFKRPNIKHVILDECSHFSWWDHPQEIAYQIKLFLSSFYI